MTTVQRRTPAAPRRPRRSGPAPHGQPLLTYPSCTAARSSRVCPRCGHDLLARTPAAPYPVSPPAGGEAIAEADPDSYQASTAPGDLEAPRPPFPRHWPTRRFPLTGVRAWIGRGGPTRAGRPDIDLGRWPADPRVSRLHAVLFAAPTGTWMLLDPGSADGVTLNTHPAPVPADILIPLDDGDRIHLGAWTTITLHRR